MGTNNIEQPVRLAVVGAGSRNIATSNHLPAIAKLKNVKLVALCDINKEGVKAESQKWGVKWYTDYEKLLADEEIDAVDICTPDWCHCEQVVQAAAAHKHILCEKPMALTIEDADKMIKAVRTAGVIFMSCHQRRFTRLFKNMRELIVNDLIGDVVYSKITHKGSFFPYPENSPYRKEYTGGQFVHNGAHLVDTLFFVIGKSDVAERFAKAKSVYKDENDCLDTANYTSVMLKFENGTLASIEQNLTMLNPRGYPTKQEIMIIGTKGTINWNSLDNAAIQTYSNGYVSLTDPASYETPHAEMIGYFADCIITNSEPAINIEFSRKVLEVCLTPVNMQKQTWQPLV